MHCFKRLDYVSTAFWYLDRDKAMSSKITGFDRPFARENFRPAGLCLNVKKNQKSQCAKSGLYGMWVKILLI